jgi:hypothetical protein
VSFPRLAVAALALLSLLAWAGGALAAAAPSLVVSESSTSLGGSGSVTAELEAGGAAGIILYIPPGYSARLDHAPGTPVGEASATAEVSGAVVELRGAALAESPGQDACGSASHDAVWTLSLAGDGVSLEVPLAVDAVTDGAESAFASYRLEACPEGMRLVRVRLTLTDVLTKPGSAGAHVFRAVATPAGASAPVEARSTVLLPVRLDLEGSYDRRTGRAILRGVLEAGGEPVAGRRVRLLAGAGRGSLEPSGSTVTGGEGRFTARRAIGRTTWFEATASVQAEDVTATGCEAPIASGGCVSATLGPFEAASRAVKVAVPRPRLLSFGSRGLEVARLQRELARLRYLPSGAVNGVFGERTWHAVVAFQGWQRLGRDGVVRRSTWAALEHARVPRPSGGLRRGLEVDLSRQVLLLVGDGRVVRAIHVSTGAYGRTPRGRFSVFRRERLSWSVPFQTWMPYANYFYGGFAIHGYASVPAHPASHGCIRVPLLEAPTVYAFAAYGAPVWIH